MNIENAIKKIDNLKNELSAINETNYDTWLTSCASYIREFLGVDSDEYLFIKSISARHIFEIESHIRYIKINGSIFLDNTKKKLNDYGLKKKEWKHILITTHPAVFWSVGLAIVAASFLIGKLTEEKNINMPTYIKEKPNDSILYKK